MSYYVHNVPGRLRVKSPTVKNNADAADDIRKALSTVRGIATVDINLITGSILINYNPKTVCHAEIVRLLQRKKYFEPEKATTHDQYIHRMAAKAGHFLGKAVLGSVVEQAFEGSALSLISLLI